GFMLVGAVVWLAAEMARERRERRTLAWTWFTAAIGLGFCSALLAVSSGNLGRYQHNVCVLLTLAGVLGWLMLVRGARALWPRATLALGMAAAVPAAYYVARADLHWGVRYAQAMREIGHQQVAMAGWISAHVPATDRVMANDV